MLRDKWEVGANRGQANAQSHTFVSVRDKTRNQAFRVPGQSFLHLYAEILITKGTKNQLYYGP